MALPSTDDLKAYLRIETDAEDELLDDFLASALSWAEVLIGKPIVATERTMDGVVPTFDLYGRHQVFLPIWPVDSSTAPVLTDYNGNTVDASIYDLDVRTGRLQTHVGQVFTASPFSIVATVGLSADPDYATKYEPRVRMLILGLAAILYKQRNPNASSDSSGGGVSVSYQMSAPFPPYLDQIMKQLRGGRIR